MSKIINMEHYSYTTNPYHKCDVEGCNKKSINQVYPSGQPAGIMHGSTMMCREHFKLFQTRYWDSVDKFYEALMNGKVSNRVIALTH